MADNYSRINCQVVLALLVWPAIGIVTTGLLFFLTSWADPWVDWLLR